MISLILLRKTPTPITSRPKNTVPPSILRRSQSFHSGKRTLFTQTSPIPKLIGINNVSREVKNFKPQIIPFREYTPKAPKSYLDDPAYSKFTPITEQKQQQPEQQQQQRHIPNIKVFDSILRKKSENGNWITGITFFNKRIKECSFPPEIFTYNIILNSVVIGADQAEVDKWIKEMVFSGFSPDLVTLNTYILGLRDKELLLHFANQTLQYHEDGTRTGIQVPIELQVSCNNPILEFLGDVLNRNPVHLPHLPTTIFCSLIDSDPENGENLAILYRNQLKKCKNKGLTERAFVKLLNKFIIEERMGELQGVLNDMDEEKVPKTKMTSRALGMTPTRVSSSDKPSSGYRRGNINRESKTSQDPQLLKEWSLVIRDLCRAKKMNMALKTYESMIEDLLIPDLVLMNTIISGLCNVNEFDLALKFISTEMPKYEIRPDYITYCCLAQYHLEHKNLPAASAIIKIMAEAGQVPDKMLNTHLIKALCQTNAIDEAQGLLAHLKSSGSGRTPQMYGSIITYYTVTSENKDLNKALHYHQEMMNDPDITRTISSNKPLLSYLISKESNTPISFIPELMTSGTLSLTEYEIKGIIYDLCSSDRVQDAIFFAKEIEKNHPSFQLDIVPYNCILWMLCTQGNPQKALDLLGEIKDLKAPKPFTLNSYTYDLLSKYFPVNSLLESYPKQNTIF